MASKVWWVKDDKIGFGSLSADTGKITNLSATTGDKIKVHYYKKPTSFTATLSETPNFPDQFHEAAVCRVMQRLSAQKQDFKMASYWKNEYREFLRKGKQYKHQNRINGFQGVMQHDY